MHIRSGLLYLPLAPAKWHWHGFAMPPPPPVRGVAVAAIVLLSALVLTQRQPDSVRTLLYLPAEDGIERDTLNPVESKAQQETPPERWANPDPWVLDADDYATDFKAAPGQLSEFFSEEPTRFAHTDTWDAGSWEWPYVPDGQDARGMRSGYDWEGAGSSASVRGLDMPPDHDVFGELGPFPSLSKSDELFPGVKSWDTVMPASRLPGKLTVHEQPYQALVQRSHAQSKLRTRLQSLVPNEWTDYTSRGDGVKCVCDSAAAGDPEMEGIDPNVKPACTCTGGSKTRFTNTETGGPLDTGGVGAWPHDLPLGDGAAYIDGMRGNNAYAARPQALAVVGERMRAGEERDAVGVWNALVRLAQGEGSARTRGPGW